MKNPIYVILDDGHGAITPGKRSPIFDEDFKVGRGKYQQVFPEGTCFLENWFNSPTTKLAYKKLKEENFYVVENVPTDEDVSLKERVRRAEEFGNMAAKKKAIPIFISVHANAYYTDFDGDNLPDWNDANGVDSFYFQNKETESSKSKKLATIMQKHLVEKTKGKDRRVKGRNFYLLRNLYPTNVYPILIECGFMTNKEELKKLASESYQDSVATAIVNFIKEVQKSDIF